MFRVRNWKQTLGLMALGSIFTIIGMLLSPVTAQRDKFGHIQCSGTTVADAQGNIRVVISADRGFGGGNVQVYGEYGGIGAELNGGYRGGSVVTNAKNGKSNAFIHSWFEYGLIGVEDDAGTRMVTLAGNDQGGEVKVHGKRRESNVRLIVTEYGGHLQVNGEGKGAVAMGINEDGDVSTWDKNGNRQ